MRFLELRRRLSSAKNAARLTPLITAFSVLTVAFGQTALTTAQIARRVLPSVVVIQGKTVAGDVLGSGFIISKDGKIVTNLHVIRDMTVAKVHVPSRPLSGGGDVFDSVARDRRNKGPCSRKGRGP
jgi:S1-C subfamily serine protease